MEGGRTGKWLVERDCLERPLLLLFAEEEGRGEGRSTGECRSIGEESVVWEARRRRDSGPLGWGERIVTVSELASREWESVGAWRVEVLSFSVRRFVRRERAARESARLGNVGAG